MVVIILLLVAYIVNDKLSKKDINQPDINKTTTTRKIKKEREFFDINEIKIEKIEGEAEFQFFVDIYVYGKKIDVGNPFGVSKIKTLEDIAIIEVDYPDARALVIVNTKGEKLYATGFNNELYCVESDLGCYGYIIDNNKITYTMALMGQDPEFVLCNSNSEYNFYEYELTYENGILSSPKVINKMTTSEIIEKYNITCNKN